MMYINLNQKPLESHKKTTKNMTLTVEYPGFVKGEGGRGGGESIEKTSLEGTNLTLHPPSLFKFNIME